VAHAVEAEETLLEANRAALGFTEASHLSAAISPHDDYVYAQQVYIHLYPYLKADHVILIGVAHRARNFPSCEGRLVFESFDAWHGPYGNVPISPLREDLIRSLPPGDAMVSNELHEDEHSLEAMIPFLQHFNRDVMIVPVLVPYMSFERLSELANKTAGILGKALEERKLALGDDVALLISADCVHYGDQDWGGKSYADFGTDGAGYDRGVARDLSLISDCLTGEITLGRLGNFYGRVVADDFHEYKITWCGRFSIPFGLAALIRLADRLNEPAPRGALLRYGTTLDPGRGDPSVPGLGVTAKASLHHWVGFTAIAYP
jgi:AmmeMemoRadiSam system protein B